MEELTAAIERQIDDAEHLILVGGLSHEEYNRLILTRDVYLSVIDIIKKRSYLDEEEDN